MSQSKKVRGAGSAPTEATTKDEPLLPTGARATSRRESGPSFEIDGLRYSVDRLPRANARRSAVSVAVLADSDKPPLVDRVDLFSFRSRHAFAGVVSDIFGRETGQVLGHLALVLDECERAASSEAPCVAQLLTPERRRAAENLLGAGNVLDRAADALETIGHVGEPQVKRIAYLIATSRLLARPLNALLLAPPGSGKSAVLEAVAALMPEEHVVPLARLTAHSLYYMGQDALRHRLVLIDEYDGQVEADHALRVLQSRGELRLSVTVKGKAESFLVRGPVSVMSGSSSSELDLQNTSRCVELMLDDSVVQTRLVQQSQARAWAGLPLGPKIDLEAWKDAQRLLAEDVPREIVIPFAPRLSFPARTTADRRASAKLLGMVAAHALLHARQRDRDAQDRTVATVTDYAAVHALVRPAFVHETAGLSPRAGRVYRHLLELGAPSGRREIADACGWTYNTAKKALAELEGQELVRLAELGPPARYLTVGRSILGGAAALTAPDDLEWRAAPVARAKR